MMGMETCIKIKNLIAIMQATIFNKQNSTKHEHTSIQELDHDFSDAEIIEIAKYLKNNKSCGEDGVFNEYIKNHYWCIFTAIQTIA